MRKCLISLIVLVLAAVSAPIVTQANAANAVVAVINGVSLIEPELNQEINVIMPMNQAYHGKLSEDKMKKIRAEALKNLVDYELMAQDAQRKNIKLTQQALDEEIAKITVKFQTTEALVAAYTGAGFTEKSFVRMFERRLLAEKIRQLEVDAKVTVTPEKVKSFYSVNEAKYSKPEEFRARHILLKVEPASTQEERTRIRTKAEDILKKITKGADFGELARTESDDLTKIKGGDLGYFHAGQSVEEFEAALFKLKVGDTSAVVESIYGYHIIQLTDRRAPRQIPFEELKDKIEKDLVEAEKKQLLTRWMEGLYKKAVISYPGEK